MQARSAAHTSTVPISDLHTHDRKCVMMSEAGWRFQGDRAFLLALALYRDHHRVRLHSDLNCVVLPVLEVKLQRCVLAKTEDTVQHDSVQLRNPPSKGPELLSGFAHGSSSCFVDSSMRACLTSLTRITLLPEPCICLQPFPEKMEICV